MPHQMIRRTALFGVSLLVSMLVYMHAYAQNTAQDAPKVIGKVTALEGGAFRVDAQGRSVALTENAAVFAQDVLQTNDAGKLKVKFIDDTIFTLAEGSTFKVNNFIYDEQTKAGDSLFEVVKGSFLYVSGIIAKTNPEAATINTTVGVIGIRGTIVAGDLLGQNANDFNVSLLDGAIEVDVFGAPEPIQIADNFTTINGSLLDGGGLELERVDLSANDAIGNNAAQFALLNQDELVSAQEAISSSLIEAGRADEAAGLDLNIIIEEGIERQAEQTAEIEAEETTEEEAEAEETPAEEVITVEIEEDGTVITTTTQGSVVSVQVEGEADRRSIIDTNTILFTENAGEEISYAGSVSFMGGDFKGNLSLQEADSITFPKIGDVLEMNSEMDGDEIINGSMQIANIYNVNDGGDHSYQYAVLGRWEASPGTQLSRTDLNTGATTVYDLNGSVGFWVRGSRTSDFPLTGSATYNGFLAGDYVDSAGNIAQDSIHQDSTISLTADFGASGGPTVSGNMNVEIMNGGPSWTDSFTPVPIATSGLGEGGFDASLSSGGALSGEFFGAAGEVPQEVGGTFTSLDGAGGTATGVYIAHQ